MAKEEFDPAKLKYISDEGVKYFNQMMEAHKSGRPLEDIMDVPGLEALRKFTNSAMAAQRFGQDGDTAAAGPKAAIVPTVTEMQPDGRMVGYDLFSLLMKQRVVLLEGEVDATMASIACASLLYLKSDVCPNHDDPITVHINSPGGSVLAGLAIYDVMRSIKPHIKTIGYGMQASMGSILLAAGDERQMTRNSALMIHQISGGNEGKASAMEISMGFSEELHEKLKNIYVRHIGLTHEFWDLALEHDTWLTAEQAKKMGFIDKIIMGDTKPTKYEADSIRDQFSKSAEAQVPKTAEGIVAVVNSVSSEQGKWAKLRPQLITALSQYPRFWTEGKKAEEAQKAAAAKASNDDNKVAAPAVKTPGPGL
jgi:ATP-dependent Clp protease protease subunit